MLARHVTMDQMLAMHSEQAKRLLAPAYSPTQQMHLQGPASYARVHVLVTARQNCAD